MSDDYTLEDAQEAILDVGGPRVEDEQKLEEVRNGLEQSKPTTVTFESDGKIESIIIPGEERTEPPGLGKMVDDLRDELTENPASKPERSSASLRRSSSSGRDSEDCKVDPEEAFDEE